MAVDTVRPTITARKCAVTLTIVRARRAGRRICEDARRRYLAGIVTGMAIHWTYWLIIVSWFGYLAYWAVAALNVKKEASRKGGSRQEGILLRLALFGVLLWIAAYRPAVFHRIFSPFAARGQDPAISDAGAVLCALGVAFAIWARRHLGRNWSPQPSLKVGHELVTSGPYGWVRHPIYTGLVTALLGTALTGSALCLLLPVLALIAFLRRIPKEEGIMAQEFPRDYPAYKARTKALLPFVW